MRLHNDAYFFIKRQFMYLGAGVVLAVLVSLFDYHKWRDWEFLSFYAVPIPNGTLTFDV